MSIIHRFIFTLAIGLVPAGMEAAPFTVPETFDSMPLGRHMLILEDPDRKLAIEDIASADAARFRESTEDVPYFAFTDSAYWARVTLASASRKRRALVFELAYPLMDHVSFFEEKGRGAFTAVRTGYRLSFARRAAPHRHFIFKTSLGPGETRSFYFRFQNEDRMEIPLSLWSAEAFARKDHDEQYVMGIYFGIILFIVAFNLFLFVSIRDRTYLYYVLFVAAYGFFQLTQNGYMCEYFWPTFLPGQSRSIPVSIALTLLTMVQFTRSFLDIGKRHPVLGRIMTGVTIYLAASMLFQLVLGYPIVILIQAVGSVLVLLFVIYVGIFSLARGYRPAKFFMIAWSAITVGGILYAMKVLAVLPSTLITSYGVQIGSVLQFILLSLGLGDRINLMKMEKEHAQAEALAAHEIAIQNLRESARLKDEHLAEMERTRREIEDLNENLKRRVEELNEANRRIGLSEERYRILVEGSKDIIFSLDEGLNIISVNRSVQSYFKMEPDSFIGRNLMDLIYEGADGGEVTKRLVREKLDEFARTRQPISFRAEFKSPIKAEPTEMQVQLEYLAIGGKNEILGKAASVVEDAILRYFECERQRYVIGNYLLTADDISHRITRNLRKHMEQRQVTMLRIAIREMIINAIEHGNLELSFEEKTDAMDSDRYFEIIAVRQKDPRFTGRKVFIEYQIDADRCVYRISDEGPGFDHRRIMNAASGEANESLLSHGRGIAMARQIFDRIEFNQKGNQVVLTKQIGGSDGG